MKVLMSADGTLNIYAENSIEIYALKKWIEDSRITDTDPKYFEDHYYKGSFISIYTGEDE